jgi:hypothetical protein
VASNYEVNIKLNTRTVNKQLNNLEKRISKLNKLAQGGRANRAVNKREKERLNEAVKLTRQEQRTLRIKQKQLKVDQQQLKVEKQTAAALVQQNRISTPKGRNFGQVGGSIGPALPPRTGGSTGGTAARGGNRFAGAASSAVISGAFPLLFGQGPLIGAAGALGGGLGSLVGGQMGGFAGGLAATSIATPLQQFAIEAGKLGQALDPATKNVEALTAALGVTGTKFEKQIATLKKLGDDEAAFEAARQKMINLVGSNGVDALTKFGQGMTELGNNFAKIMTLMRTSFALFVQNSGIGKFIAQTLERATLLKQAEVQGQNTDSEEGRELQTLLKTRKLTERFGGLNPERRRELILNLTNQETGTGLFGEIHDRDVDKAREIVNDLIVKNQILINTKNAQKEADKMIDTIQTSRVKNLDKEIEMLERSFGMTSEQFEIEKQIAEMKEEGEVKDEDELRRKLQKIQMLTEERKLAEETAAAFERMSQTIATDISQGIQGMIRGTSTLNDMLNNVLNKLIDAAFNMAFFGNQQGKLGGGGLFGSILGGLGGIFGGGDGGALPPSPIKKAANGGRIPGGRASLVGEKGPELFTPATSGFVTPNHALGGSVNVSVNVDASGTSTEGDGASGEQLGRLIGAAVQAELIKEKRPGGLLG